MDLDTENRIASMLMKEAAELRCQAEKEGVHAYLREQKVRGRPNSRFLTATVLGVQQANRVVEVNEMWRVRQKEIELSNKLKGGSSNKRSYRDQSDSASSGDWERNKSHAFCTSKKVEADNCYSSEHGGNKSRAFCTSKNVEADNCYSSEHGGNKSRGFCTSKKVEADNCYSSEDGGLKDEEVEEFLHKRVKRGRGAVGSRTDETGPYLPDVRLDSNRKWLESPDRVREDWECRVLGPEMPPLLKSQNTSEDESDRDDWKKSKKFKLVSKKHSRKHIKKENDMKGKKRNEKKSNHHRKSRHS